ncbi:hypothetical protein SAY86_022687 [Trapa natans]|uniref:DUF1664 domain-containing protein n=1 Tax=Trapa natans TaxID=22666 RepID=A0AAN7LTW5_TRANT|nr:hypothetical protein SAY86_022687 [Trapa natans]
MAMHSGLGISKILILAGAGYTGTILLNNGKLSDLLGELQKVVKGLEKTGLQSDGESDYSEAIAAQVRRLTMEVRKLASSQGVTVLNGSSGQICNLTNMIVPAATLGALGYGYMWWKGLSFSDLMYVTKRNMANAVANLTQNLECVTEALNAAKRHLTQRMENLDGKMDDQRELSKEIKNDVCVVKSNLDGIGYELETLQQLVFGLDGRLGSLEYNQDWANTGIRYLCCVANGQKVEMPKILQEQLKISGAPRANITYPNHKGLKDFADVISECFSPAALESKGQDCDDNSHRKNRVFVRAPSLIKS